MESREGLSVNNHIDRFRNRVNLSNKRNHQKREEKSTGRHESHSSQAESTRKRPGMSAAARKAASARMKEPNPLFTTSQQGVMLPVQALTSQVMEIQFTTRIFKEGRTFVAHALELDVSSCGGTKEKALTNLKEAVRLFLEEAENMGTLEQILKEAGYAKTKQKIASPKFSSVQRVTIRLPLTHAKA